MLYEALEENRDLHAGGRIPVIVRTATPRLVGTITSGLEHPFPDPFNPERKPTEKQVHIARTLSQRWSPDTEFDAEERFHQRVIELGGKGVAPLRHKNVKYYRINGSRRKQLSRKWPGRSYNRRPLTETANSMLKRGLGETLRGRTVWQQSRHFYMKCFTHNILLRCN